MTYEKEIAYADSLVAPYKSFPVGSVVVIRATNEVIRVVYYRMNNGNVSVRVKSVEDGKRKWVKHEKLRHYEGHTTYRRGCIAHSEPIHIKDSAHA